MDRAEERFAEYLDSLGYTYQYEPCPEKEEGAKKADFLIQEGDRDVCLCEIKDIGPPAEVTDAFLNSPLHILERKYKNLPYSLWGELHPGIPSVVPMPDPKLLDGFISHVVGWIGRNQSRARTGMQFMLPWDYVKPPTEAVEIIESDSDKLVAISIRSDSGGYPVWKIDRDTGSPGQRTYLIRSSDGVEKVLGRWETQGVSEPLLSLELSFERAGRDLKLLNMVFVIEKLSRAVDRVKAAYDQLKQAKRRNENPALPLVAVLTSTMFTFERDDLLEVAFGERRLSMWLSTKDGTPLSKMTEYLSGKNAIFATHRNKDLWGIARLTALSGESPWLSVITNPFIPSAHEVMVRCFRGPKDEFFQVGPEARWERPHAKV